MMGELDLLFEEDGLPVSAFEDPDSPDHWKIAVYVDSGDAERVRERLEEIARNADAALRFSIEQIPDTDWVKATLRDLEPVHAGRFVVHGSHDAHLPRTHEHAVQIDAGLAFGTGHHGTTAGCLDMIECVFKRRRFHNMLDLGTGSGVLAIAIAKALPCRVLATDIDPVATSTARQNAHINGTAAAVTCHTATGFRHPEFGKRKPFDLIVANILARPLQHMARDLARHLAPGGIAVLSGLLPHQRAAILATFRIHGLVHQHTHIRDGWLILVLCRPG